MESKHHYGENYHILSKPVLTTLLNTLSQPQTKQPLVNDLMSQLYEHLLFHVLDRELSLKQSEVATRMTASHPDQKLSEKIVDPKQTVVTVNLARAGTLPSHVCFNVLNRILNPDDVRQDHVWASRLVNDNHQVTGTDLGAAKIGGSVKASLVLIPDPMGATGGTVVSTVDLYQKHFDGHNARFVALHLIITPEYLKYLKDKHPKVKVYALRLDRGLSSTKALKAEPGLYWNEEKGLNERQYIVPGAGGLGEVLNNSFV